jgi:hypothetical protein
MSPAPQGVSIIRPSLPFPIVATTSPTIKCLPVAIQNLPKSGSNLTKSTLKVTSKIPRINKKPYVRKAPEKSANETRKPTDSAKVIKSLTLQKIIALKGYSRYRQ